MGHRKDFTDGQIADAISAADGHLATAARILNESNQPDSKVTRQNLQTWVAAMPENDGVYDDIAHSELIRKNRMLTNANNLLRREARHATDAALTKQTVLSGIKDAIVATSPAWPMPYIPRPVDGRKITIELLFSDIQIGKLMDDYNTDVAQRRVDEWVEVAVARIRNYELQGYKIERIVLAVLGDIIESDKKHVNSGRACDIGTADQMKVGIEVLFEKVIKHLALIGAPMDVVMITGNHDHDDHGLNMFMPGREHLSWPIYHAVRALTETAGIEAQFYIPSGSFHIYTLYGQKVLYEHGVGVATSEAAMRKHVGNRINQQKDYIDLFRMGDKHNVCRFNNDRYVVNGAFFGDSRHGEEYSGIVGYDGEPAQIMFAHVERRDNYRTSIFDSLSIQLGHIK